MTDENTVPPWLEDHGRDGVAPSRALEHLANAALGMAPDMPTTLPEWLAWRAEAAKVLGLRVPVSLKSADFQYAAAELRRLADQFKVDTGPEPDCAGSHLHYGLRDAEARLRARADELDPPTAPTR